MWDAVDDPVIAHLPWQTRERLANIAWKRMVRRPRYWVEAFLGFVMQLTACVLMFVQLRSWNHVVGKVVIGIQLAAVVWYVFWIRRMRQHFVRALDQVLRSEGVRPRICLACGYDLQHHNSDRCPECGASVSASNTQTPAT
jgi:hypothetical protein